MRSQQREPQTIITDWDDPAIDGDDVMARALSVSALKGADKHVAFRQALAEQRIPLPVMEHRFHEARKWAFDYCWPDAKIALEVEGGIWVKGGGGHNRGKAYLDDMEKMNAAVVMGWRIVRVVPSKLCSVETLDMLKALLKET